MTTTIQHNHPLPTSPPPSFRSRTSSLSSQRHVSHDERMTRVNQTLADTFNDGYASDVSGDNDGDDRQTLIRGCQAGQGTSNSGDNTVVRTQMRGAQSSSALPATIPVLSRTHVSAIPHTAFSSSNDGVFANLNAKPERGEKTEEQPPVRERRYCLLTA